MFIERCLHVAQDIDKWVYTFRTRCRWIRLLWQIQMTGSTQVLTERSSRKPISISKADASTISTSLSMVNVSCPMLANRRTNQANANMKHRGQIVYLQHGWQNHCLSAKAWLNSSSFVAAGCVIGWDRRFYCAIMHGLMEACPVSVLLLLDVIVM